MATVNGDWFHSRSSSNWDELLAVRILVIESQKPEYTGFPWSGGRQQNPHMYELAGAAGIQPSTMQTKIRAMIRYGFLREGNTCPLVWTRMGSVWNDLYSVGNYSAAKNLYHLILAISIALYAFNNSAQQYTRNPAKGEMPLKYLLGILDSNESISLDQFEQLVDGNRTRSPRNASYWKRDLINTGLFQEKSGRLFYTGKYDRLVHEIRNFVPIPYLDDMEWQAIRENPLVETSPFKESVEAIFEKMIQAKFQEDDSKSGPLTEPVLEIVAEQQEILIPEVDILSTNSRFAQSLRRIRNATWAVRIKKKYSQHCAVPRCDVLGQLFVEAAHIKPDSLPDGDIPHRSHILNGLCLCKVCHVAFDKGYFTLSDECQVITSRKFDEIPNQNLKTVILSSRNAMIKSRTDNRFPLVEFVRYHRMNLFKG